MGEGPDRRGFLRSVLTASLVFVPACRATLAHPTLPGPRLRLGLIGAGRQGRRHLLSCLERGDVEVVAVADPDLEHLRHASALAQARGHHALPHRDARQLLDDPGIDAVVIATPDHWHCLLALWALDAGKHVYVESPASHGMVEGELMAAAAARSRHRLQAALPLRCSEGMRRGVAFVHDGGLGEIEWVRALCYVYRPRLGLVQGPGRPPPSVDYDLWAGPAEPAPLRRFRLHDDWRFDWSTGSGDIGEWGVHLLDLARWILRAEGLPPMVWTCGGRFGPPDAGQTPNTLVAALHLERVPVVFEVRNLAAMTRRRARMDQVFGMSLGVVVGGRRGHALFDPLRGVTMVLGHDGEPLQRFDGRGDGLARFVADLRAGSAPSVSFPVAQRSADLAHLVSLAYRTAPAQAQAPRLEIVRDLADVAVALQSVDAMDQHLARQGWNLHQLAPRRSGWQAVTATGEFADLPRANDLRVRTYRAPFTPGGSLRPG